jgi:hypothetical protein
VCIMLAHDTSLLKQMKKKVNSKFIFLE